MRTAPRSFFAVAGLFIVLAVMRCVSLTANELSWDVFGYYLYLPATFVHGDPLLHDVGWVRQAMETYHASGTLYQLSTAPDNSTPMYFFLMGMSICYLPFFLLGHVLAYVTGAPTDGFSLPYQYSVAIGSLAYALIGLVHVRRVLLRYFSDGIVAVTIGVVVLGTNYLHFATTKNLETANFLFCWIAVMVWNTARWHDEQRFRNMMWIAFSVAMITLIKPSEVLCGLLPLFWGVHDRASLGEKVRLLRSHGSQVLVALAIGGCLLAPQLLYWKTLTGSFIYDSYKNPGVGLDLARPHIRQILFSFRKGWLIYTPVMLFALAGFVFLFRRERRLFWAILVYCSASFYVIASWSEWWYGASYSVRPMITLYPLLAIPLGFSLLYIWERPRALRLLLGGSLAVFVGLNLFQLWQFRNWVIHPYRTTRAYYFAVFGSTSIPQGADRLLSVDRSFEGNDVPLELSNYVQRTLGQYEFEPEDTSQEMDRFDTLAQSHVLVLDGDHPYSPAVELPFLSITERDHAWLKARVRVFIPKGYEGDTPCLVVSMERKEGSYAYHTWCLANDSLHQGAWTTLEGWYLTPEIRDPQDRVKCYIWQRGKGSVRVDRLQLEAFSLR
jgi:hypothetical protein